MKHPIAGLLVGAVVGLLPVAAAASPPARPAIGPVEILKSSEINPGMKGVAWTVFSGTEPEPVPVEIIGRMKNAWGPGQDVIIAKLGGKVQRTNVAGGMSGTPVYIDGKLAGAISLRLSVFSPDAICGITPAEQMLEISDFDDSVPADARSPETPGPSARLTLPDGLLARVAAGGSSGAFPEGAPLMVPIETPLTFSGFQPGVLTTFGPLFERLGVTPVVGGAGGALANTKPGPGWKDSLRPGDVVAGVLVSGDLNVTGLGTVTYNDGKRVLAFGHSLFNLGPVKMPMSKGEVLMVLSSAYQPNKIANATEIVGTLRQDRHSGVLGVLGEEAPTIPVTLRVRSFGRDDAVRQEKDFHFNIFIQQKWTPTLMMLTLFNSISGLNEFVDEVTYRLSGQVELDGGQNLSLSTMLVGGDVPVPAPIQLAGWWADKFTRLFKNAVNTPHLRRVNATIDVLPERRVATVETAWTEVHEVEPGGQVPVKVFLQPYRGARIERHGFAGDGVSHQPGTPE